MATTSSSTRGGRSLPAAPALLLLGVVGMVAACADTQKISDYQEERGQASAQGLSTCITVQNTVAPPSATGVDDAQLVTDVTDPTKASTSYGSVQQMIVGYNGTGYQRLVFKFNLAGAGVPAGSAIDSAILHVRMIQSPGKAPVDVFAGTALWNESTVTWNSYASAPGGGLGALLTSIVTNGVANNSTLHIVLPNATVASWVEPATNYGIVFDHPLSGRTTIGSSEAPTVGPRPKLDVCYTAPTCSDGLQNGAETGVDCGASCAPCACAGVLCAALDACHVAGTCDAGTGQCSNPAAANGAPCDDGSPNTDGDACEAGACVGMALCDCPDGFVAAPGGECQKTYEIDVSLLDNLGDVLACDPGLEGRFNDGASAYGFHWRDRGSVFGVVTHVDVELEAGLSCRTEPTNVTLLLNNQAAGIFSHPAGTCGCEESTSLSVSGVSTAAYVKGAVNSLRIPVDAGFDTDLGQFEGLTANADWNDAFARVTVRYANDCKACTACPADYELLDGACQRTYGIDSSLLDNQLAVGGVQGDGSQNYLSDCANPYGFHWVDAGGASLTDVVELAVELQSGISCPGSTSVYPLLNGAPLGSGFMEAGICNGDSSSATVSLSELSGSSYSVGAPNHISIPRNDCAGLSTNPAWNDDLARVTVAFTCH